MKNVLHVPAFEDNYIWLVPGVAPGDTRQVIAVDPGDAAPVLAYLAEHRLTLAAIFCTHHHRDHTGGIAALVAHTPVPVYGPSNEDIATITHPVREGDCIDLPALARHFRVLDVPGHTRGHIAFYGHGLLFCGDTLFSGGCGKLFEGTAAQLHASLQKFAALPDDTAVYCAHEYTASGVRFSAAVEPGNVDLPAYAAWVKDRLARREPTLPSSIGLEKRINPFLRTAIPAVQQAAERHGGRPLTDETAVFTEIRRWRDSF